MVFQVKKSRNKGKRINPQKLQLTPFRKPQYAPLPQTHSGKQSRNLILSWPINKKAPFHLKNLIKPLSFSFLVFSSIIKRRLLAWPRPCHKPQAEELSIGQINFGERG